MGIGTKAGTAEGTVRDDGIDGLRGIAAIVVLAFHVATTRGGPISPWLSPAGDYSVAIFFAVSGFLLWRPVARRLLDGRPLPDLRDFAVRRVARIVPGYWVAITIGFWVLDSGRPHSVAETAYQYSLTQIYRQGEPGAGLFVAWTLTCEVAFYLVIAVLVYALARLVGNASQAVRTRIMLGVIAVLGAIALASRQIVLSTGAKGHWRLQWPMNLADWFAFGMLVAVVKARSEVGIEPPRWLRTALRYPWLWLLLAAELYWVLTRITASFASGTKITVWSVQGIYVLVGLATVVLLSPTVLGARDKGLAALLGSPPLAVLGRISFGVYLWHAVWLPLIDKWSTKGTIPTAFLPRLGLTLLLTLPCAWLSWELVERPFIQWAIRRTTGPRPTVAATGNA
jgi:peptidoglycan/LPS O-acetylase OafA/YrhL